MEDESIDSVKLLSSKVVGSDDIGSTVESVELDCAKTAGQK